MKRLLTLALALIMTLTLFAACNKEPEPTPTPEPEESATPEPTPTEDPEETETPEPEFRYRNKLSGEKLAEEPENLRPYAFMINNISVAQPHCGTSEADIIYEVLAEGGITRMMAIFSDITDAENIGSIRSIRPYYIELGLAYEAIIIHAGGSDDAYADIGRRSIETIDETRGRYGTEPFWRDKSRAGAGTEHTVFTTPDQMFEYTDKLGYDREHSTKDYDYGLLFTDEPVPTGGFDAEKITATFGSQKTSTFTYDSEKGAYTMYQYGSDYIDGNTGELVYFDNVIVIEAETYHTGDALAHMDINVIGGGEGYYANGGQAIEIDWRHGSSGGSFIYTQKNGVPLEIGAGKTFICIVPKGDSPTFE